MIMKRTISSLSVIALCAAVPAFAQDAAPSQYPEQKAPANVQDQGGVESPAPQADQKVEQPNSERMQQNTDVPAPLPDAETDRADDMESNRTGKTKAVNFGGPHRASKLIGTSLVNAKNESIGEINDLVLSDTGSVESVLVGVGGFIGIGEKTVAIEFSELDFMRDDDGDLTIKTSMTQEELEAAPEYKVANNL